MTPTGSAYKFIIYRYYDFMHKTLAIQYYILLYSMNRSVARVVTCFCPGASKLAVARADYVIEWASKCVFIIHVQE